MQTRQTRSPVQEDVHQAMGTGVVVTEDGHRGSVLPYQSYWSPVIPQRGFSVLGCCAITCETCLVAPPPNLIWVSGDDAVHFITIKACILPSDHHLQVFHIFPAFILLLSVFELKETSRSWTLPFPHTPWSLFLSSPA